MNGGVVRSLVFMAVITAGCTSAVSRLTPSTATNTLGVRAAPIPGATPSDQAEQLLDAVLVPPASTEVSGLPGKIFSRPTQEPACQPLIDNTRFWEVPGHPQQVANYLYSHTSSWVPNHGGGSQSDGERLVNDVPQGPGWSQSKDQLDFVIAALSNGESGIRADGEVVPTYARCISSAS